jgi:hypothetical protein
MLSKSMTDASWSTFKIRSSGTARKPGAAKTACFASLRLKLSELVQPSEQGTTSLSISLGLDADIPARQG